MSDLYEQFSMSRFATKQAREKAMMDELERLRDVLDGHPSWADIGELTETVAKLRQQRDELVAVLNNTAQYIDQTYSDLIGHLGAEWLAARFADDLLPEIKAALAKIEGEK